jgi:hypothetical protein
LRERIRDQPEWASNWTGKDIGNVRQQPWLHSSPRWVGDLHMQMPGTQSGRKQTLLFLSLVKIDEENSENKLLSHLSLWLHNSKGKEVDLLPKFKWLTVILKMTVSEYLYSKKQCYMLLLAVKRKFSK